MLIHVHYYSSLWHNINYCNLCSILFPLQMCLNLLYFQYIVSKSHIEHRSGQLQTELETLQGREVQLSIIKEGLEKELKCSKSEFEACRDKLEESQVELSKTKVYSHTLDNRNKVGVYYMLLYIQW